MLLNYLKVGLRNILKYKVFSFINVFGLAVAMTVCMLILLMLAEQRNSDRFNAQRDRIYRILCDKPDFRHPYATSPFPLSTELKAESPVISATTHLYQGVGGDAIYQQRSSEMRGYFADPSFFRVFSFNLEQGDKETALSSPNSMVISSEVAQRLFNNENPVGKSVTFTDRGLGSGGALSPTSWGRFTITGVIADKKYKSHLIFDVLVSGSSLPILYAEKKVGDISADWSNFYQTFSYALLVPGKSQADLDRALGALAKEKYTGLPDLKGFKMVGQPLMSISPGILLGNEPNIILPKIVYYILSVLALVILISACLNYTNLSIARALTRAREIGIRKVNGAARKSLILQFLSESVLTAMFALLLAMVFLIVVRAAFLHLWVNQYLNFDLQVNYSIYFAFAGLAFLIGLIAGIYPALYLSKFRPIKVLRSFESMRPGKLGLLKTLNVTQFVISLVFIISSILIYNQSSHFLRFKYEYNSRNMINVDLQSNDYKLAMRELGTVPGVAKVSACDYIPVTGRNEGNNIKQVGSKADFKNVTVLTADENFLSNLALRLDAGRNFGPGRPSDIVVNEAAVKALGYTYASQIIDQQFVSQYDTVYRRVVGVVQDFHMNLDHDQIQPLILQNQPALFRYLNIRIAATGQQATIARLEQRWKEIDPLHPLKYRFFDEQLASTSEGFFDVLSILGFIAFLAVTIACLGMLGMASYTTERRTKEVGIRKTLGAENLELVLLLSKGFLRILGIAILIAAPLSYILNTLWLRKFPNRVDFGLGTISLGSGILLVLGLITIGSQTIRAARRNPVRALKME
jgi:putative ABC transport system permease protein